MDTYRRRGEQLKDRGQLAYDALKARIAELEAERDAAVAPGSYPSSDARNNRAFLVVFFLTIGRFCPILLAMNTKQFIASIRRIGRRHGIPVTVDKRRGKGSHVLVFFGNRQTTLPARRGDIGKGLLKDLCDQLGIARDDLK